MSRWGVVSTIRAPLADIARFAAHHLDLGADSIRIFLDAPDPLVEQFFRSHPRVRITVCDVNYWKGKPARAQDSHQMRQAFNATRAYRQSDLPWLAHLDVDEFLLPARPVTEILADCPPEAEFMQMRPAEQLAQDRPNGLTHFKLTRHTAGHPPEVLSRIYPTFGEFVPEGFFSYNCFKNIARTGLQGIRFGIHAMWREGKKLSTGQISEEIRVGHAHAPSWAQFRQHMTFRVTKGAYRRRPNEPMRLADVLATIQSEEGEPGLRRFYEEMMCATPDLIEQLAKHDMLLGVELDLDETVSKWFGKLPEAAA
ncbi:glycosyltransferase family 2 protein [Primorskyibacter sp. S87]|uniref:glycosyltransferase family 2 protein n=1 Tax=Primorskyibacter sp. S87 TaxID=3415126 RepID=UPI003C7E1299